MVKKKTRVDMFDHGIMLGNCAWMSQEVNKRLVSGL